MSSRLQRKTVIYTRFSSEMQREESCEDQEREARDELTRNRIDHRNAVVLADKAESGEVADRPQFQRLLSMIDRGEVAVLAVDNQSRLTRAGASDAYSIVKDVVYHSGRFLSAAGIDTNRGDWEILVQTKGLTDGVDNRNKAKAVRRGQKGRAEKPEASVGDHTYGFATECDDPNWKYSKKNPRPRKHNVVNDEEARWMRQIFHWFAICLWSIAKITRGLNRLGAPKRPWTDKKGRRRVSPWRHHQVRRLLSNEKLIGRWSWGRTTTVRNSRGKKKQLPAPEKDVAVTYRPELRIINDTTWNKTQKRLAGLKRVYGHKNGQKPRGPRVHHTSVYPSSLLGGVLFCGACGARLVYQTGGVDVYYGCPNHRAGKCSQATRAPRKKTETVLLGFLGEEFKGIRGWMEKVFSSLQNHFKGLDTRVPQEIETKTRMRDDIADKINNIVEVIQKCGAQSAHLLDRLSEHETNLACLDTDIQQAQQLLAVPCELPPRAWTEEQIADLADILKGDVARAAPLLREILGKVHVHEVIPPGKKRGFPRLTFRIDAWAVASRVLEETDGITSAALATAPDRDFKSQEIVLDIGGPSRMDELAPKIAEMRRAGTPWSEIAEVTKLRPGNAYTAWRRYTDAVAASISAGADGHEKEVAAG